MKNALFAPALKGWEGGDHGEAQVRAGRRDRDGRPNTWQPESRDREAAEQKASGAIP